MLLHVKTAERTKCFFITGTKIQFLFIHASEIKERMKLLALECFIINILRRNHSVFQLKMLIVNKCERMLMS